MQNSETEKLGTLIIGDLDAGGGNKIDLYYKSETGVVTEVKTFSNGTVLHFGNKLEYIDGLEYGPGVQKLLDEIRAGRNPKPEVIITDVGITDLMRELAPQGCPECAFNEFDIIAETSGKINIKTGKYETDGFDLIQVDCAKCGHTLRE